jgi:spermidine synthase
MKLRVPSRAEALAFLTAFVTLLVQILVHRMVSAKLLNNYAFLVISLTMLGFAFSGVVLSRLLPWFLEHWNDAITASAAFFALTTVGVSVLFYHADVDIYQVDRNSGFVLSLMQTIPLALLFAIPFTFCGLILGALLSSPELSARRIYGFDLAGSALGAFAVIPAITYMGVEWSAVLASAVLLSGALLLVPPIRVVSRALAASVVLILVLSFAFSEKLFVMTYPKGSMLAFAQQPGSQLVIEHIAWDPVARIEVSRIPLLNHDTDIYARYPSLVGDNRAFMARFKRVLTQNNYAFTYAVDYDGTKESLQGIEETIYSAAYHATSVRRPRTLVIGVGGGFDVLTALAFDATDIMAVEINSATVGILTRTYRDYFRKWVEDTRVHLISSEGRHFLATTDRRFDIIQLSGVDSFSGTLGAAHVFSENYLYTAEAFDLYLSRLTDDGILNMMRLEYPRPREMLRALTTAVEALRRMGVERPADHIMMLTQTNGRFTALLVKKTPFTTPEMRRLEEWSRISRFFKVSAGPHVNIQVASIYQDFLSLGDPQKEALFIARYPFDISPVDDNRPFFFRFSFWWHLFASDPMVWQHIIPMMEYSVILLVAAIGLAIILCIYLPLRYFNAHGLRTRHASRYTVYFAGTGLAYLAIEIALLQKFGLFLGHPNYALSVVLAALLLATGLGSLYSTALVKALGGVRFVSYILATLILVEYGLVFPRLPGLIGLPFWGKVAIVSAIVCPIGISLGMFLPVALEQLKHAGPSFVPWAWGINGIFSVLAPVLSVAFSITWGSNALLLSAIPIYLVVGFSLPTTPDTPGLSGLSIPEGPESPRRFFRRATQANRSVR